MANLVHRLPKAAAWTQGNRLGAVPLHSDVRKTSVLDLERHEIGKLSGIRGGSLDESDLRIRLPMIDRLRHHGPESGHHREWNEATGPAKRWPVIPMPCAMTPRWAGRR